MNAAQRTLLGQVNYSCPCFPENSEVNDRLILSDENPLNGQVTLLNFIAKKINYWNLKEVVFFLFRFSNTYHQWRNLFIEENISIIE